MAKTKLYARPEGWHYHTDRNCSMLAGGDFERLGYVEITLKEAKKRKLRPCACADKKHGFIRSGGRAATEEEIEKVILDRPLPESIHFVIGKRGDNPYDKPTRKAK